VVSFEIDILLSRKREIQDGGEFQRHKREKSLICQQPGTSPRLGSVHEKQDEEVKPRLQIQ
jgi:hypothetical protein